MIPRMSPNVWAFDAEWVPDPDVGRRLYDLGPDASDRTVIEEMWKQGGADEERPRPYLKPVLCRLVSIVAICRRCEGRKAELGILSLPQDPSTPGDEKELIASFLTAVSSERPQLVGYNSRGADLRILIQRSVANSLSFGAFARLDYLSWRSSLHVDLMNALAGGGRGTPSLHELAVASRIPGKMDVSGGDVVDLWLAGRLPEIVAYNELDALTTYLLWLRAALFSGHIGAEEHDAELALVTDLLDSQSIARPHFARFKEKWRAFGR